MWVEIICGLIVYRLFRHFLYSDDILEVETSDANALFSVANRLEKLFGGMVYVGLRIPDADTGTRQNIDIVQVTKGEAVVISVKNLSGFLSVSADGSWVCEGGSKHKTERLPDPVVETKKQASILESYLEQRGVALPEGYFSCKVVLPNPKLRTIHSSYFSSEVITYDQLVQLKPEPKSIISGWIKGAFRGGKKEMQESIHQKLDFILTTAPIWDRLELKGNKYVLGEFLDFKGKQEDINALKNIRRSKVSRMIIQKMSMFGFGNFPSIYTFPYFVDNYAGVDELFLRKEPESYTLWLTVSYMEYRGFETLNIRFSSFHGPIAGPSTLQVLYSPRDYRSGGASASEWKEVNVRSGTEVLLQPQDSSKVCKFKLSSVVSLSLSA